MKTILKLWCLLLSIITVATFNINSHALSMDNQDNQSNITKVYRVTSDGLKEISIEEYLNFKSDINDSLQKNSINNRDGIEPQGITDDWYRYDESSYSTVRRSDLNRRVSVPMYNDTSNNTTSSISYSTSQGHTININLSGLKMNAVRGGTFYTYNNSASINSSYTLTVSPNHYGWFEFEPTMYKSTGYLKTFGWKGDLKSSEFIETYYPKKVGSNLDGFLIARESRTQPN